MTYCIYHMQIHFMYFQVEHIPYIDGLVQERHNSILKILQENKKPFTEVIIIPICKELPVVHEIQYCHSYGTLKWTTLTLKHYVIGVTTSCHLFWIVQEGRNSIIWSYIIIALKYQSIFICLSKVKKKNMQSMPRKWLSITFCVSHERLNPFNCS